VWGTNYRKGDLSYKPRSEDAIQVVWDSIYRNDPGLVELRIPRKVTVTVLFIKMPKVPE